MTSLNPSHIPGLHRTDDRKSGQAVYDSVSPLHTLSGHLAEQDRRRTRRSRRSPLDSDDEGSSDGDESEGGRDGVPIPPIPDLRFEQGVLASIRPFLHRADGPEAEDAAASGGKPSRLGAAEKGAMASANLTADGGAKGEHPSDVFMSPLRVEWSKVTYVLLRDQVVFPLLQGALWGVAGFYLNAIWNWNKVRLAAKASGSRRPSLLRSVGINAR